MGVMVSGVESIEIQAGLAKRACRSGHLTPLTSMRVVALPIRCDDLVWTQPGSLSSVVSRKYLELMASHTRPQ